MDPESKQERKQTGIRLRFLYLVLILGALSACGKKGPLYLPPGMMPVLKHAPEVTVESDVKATATPVEDASKKASPTVTPADKEQP